MGVVRREGDWRLEKIGTGRYEVTFQEETQMKIYTSKASRNTDSFMIEPVPTREVETYSEAEGLFEEKAHGPPPLGAESTTTSSSTSSTQGPLAEEGDVPPAGLVVVLFVVGGVAFSMSGSEIGSVVFLFGGAALLAGVAIIGYAGFLFREEGLSEAVNFLIAGPKDGDSGSSKDSGGEQDSVTKSPPASEKLKNQLIFDRAGQRCEWCEERFDHPHVHHIVPRSEGGPNEPDNLIVLCPNCHEKADREAIPQSKLEAKVRRKSS